MSEVMYTPCITLMQVEPMAQLRTVFLTGDGHVLLVAGGGDDDLPLVLLHHLQTGSEDLLRTFIGNVLEPGRVQVMRQLCKEVRSTS